MAVTEQMSQSKKAANKKSSDNTNFNSPSKKRTPVEESDSSSEEDDSETDLDKPLFKKPSQGKSFVPQKQVPNAQNPNGDVSDSETDIDKPPRQSVNTKRVVSTGSAGGSAHSQSAAPQSSDDDSDDSDSEDQQQSMSLLQTRSINISPGKKSAIKSSSQTIDKDPPARSHVQGKVSRKPSAPEMSSSESDSDSEAEAAAQPQQQRGSKSKEDEAGKEQGAHMPNANHLQSINVKQEMESPSESSSYEEDEEKEEEKEEGMQEMRLTGTGAETPTTSILQGSQNQQTTNPSPRQAPPVVNTAATIQAFEAEHTPISAPVVNIPPDSRVWFLQVPCSVSADHLQGIRLPTELKGGEVLDLPTGRWKILNLPYEKSHSDTNCITSTGHLSYAIHSLKPEAFWYLKRMPASIHSETGSQPWDEEVTPIPIEELLKIKGRVSTKTGHLRKRHRESGNIPSENFSSLPPEDQQSLKKKKKRHHLHEQETESSIMDQQSPKKKKKRHHLHEQETESSIMGEDAEVGKKRKRHSESGEESPFKKKQKHSAENADAHMSINSAIAENSSLYKVKKRHLWSEGTDANMSIHSPTDEDSSRHKKKKKKHKDHGDTTVEGVTSLTSQVTVKQEYTASDDKWRERSVSKDQQITPGVKEHKRKSHAELEYEDKSAYMKPNPNVDGESEKKKKKKKKKKMEKYGDNSEQEETYQMNKEKKKKHLKIDHQLMSTSVTEKTHKKHLRKEKNSEMTLVDSEANERRKKNKHAEGEADVSDRTNKKESVTSNTEDLQKKEKKKKKKHKEKDSNELKIKQEDAWWEREASPDVLKRLFLTQITPEDV